MDKTIEVAEKVKTFLINEMMENDFSNEDYEKTIIYLHNWFEAEATFLKNKGEIRMEETKMPMVTRDMTDEELIALRKAINEILGDREKEKAKKAIENFRKAFEEVKKVVYEITVGEDEWAENCYCIEDFKQFHFDI